MRTKWEALSSGSGAASDLATAQRRRTAGHAAAPVRLPRLWRHSSGMHRPARQAWRRQNASRRRLRRASCAPCDVTAPRACAARSTAHYASHAKLLNLDQCSSSYKRLRYSAPRSHIMLYSLWQIKKKNWCPLLSNTIFSTEIAIFFWHITRCWR